MAWQAIDFLSAPTQTQSTASVAQTAAPPVDDDDDDDLFDLLE